jgi:3-dehydroquinate dehydratase/shikimate dehydrogenase
MIIVSITGPRMSDALAQVASSAQHADAVELRLDLIRSPELPVLLLATSKPVIATCRPVWEGGGFAGPERDRLQMLRTASLLGAEYIDLEFRTDRRLLQPFFGRTRDARVLLSLHLPPGKRPVAGDAYKAMRRLNADVFKLAFHASDAWENKIAFDFLDRARKDGRKAIAIAMGEAGEPSRVLYRVFGGFATYAGTEDGALAAPGQLPASVMKEMYHADRLNRSTRIFGVVGNPVRQSKGVIVHNRLFGLAGKNAVYCRFLVKNLSRFMKELAPCAHGFSVTIPHKQAMMRQIHSVDPGARAIGAVNTILRRQNGWWGTNTDAPAALDAIERLAQVQESTILLLGAGGAARAIAYEARKRGAKVLITNHRPGRARALAREFGLEFVAWEKRGTTECDIIVNATPVGMAPATGSSPVPPKLLRGKIVFDAVYTPPVTRLLRDALRAGARVIPGTDMYVNQAARQFRLYAGVPADLALMKKVLLEASAA